MNQEEWAFAFSHAKHGHILWDGTAPDPKNPAHAYTTAWKFVNHAMYLGFFKPKNRILDLGCGNGRFGIPFSEMDVRYEGVDPVKPCIDFCRTTFRPFPHLQFHFADIYNEVFNKHGGVDPAHYRLPYDDRSFDDVICYSVFTHLQTLEVAKNYMAEVKRVLKPGGKLFCSWYRSPPNPSPDPYVGRTVYAESDILTMLQGFSCEYSYGGHTDVFYDQWALFCTRRLLRHL